MIFFSVGHGGIPLIVVYTTLPIALFFIVNLFLVTSKFRHKVFIEKDSVFVFLYSLIWINIVVNVISSFAVF